MKFALTTAGLLTAASLLALPALAHGGPHRLFEKMDKNSDGKVTLSEAHAVAKERFESMDANRDSVVTRTEAEKHLKTEMKKHRPSRADLEERFKEADKNNNGKLERSESRLPDRLFDEADTNGDDALTREELRAAFVRMTKSSEKAKAWREKHFERFFQRLDRDQNGKITEEEATSAMSAHFARLDRNNDKAVTKSEVAEFRQHQGPRRHHGHGDKGPGEKGPGDKGPGEKGHGAKGKPQPKAGGS